jgi:hypothetical protein
MCVSAWSDKIDRTEAWEAGTNNPPAIGTGRSPTAAGVLEPDGERAEISERLR